MGAGQQFPIGGEERHASGLLAAFARQWPGGDDAVLAGRGLRQGYGARKQDGDKALQQSGAAARRAGFHDSSFGLKGGDIKRQT